MPPQDVKESSSGQGFSTRQRWDRLVVAEKLPEYQATEGNGGERARAEKVGVPRSTLRQWEAKLPVDDEEARFFASPLGLRLLQRVMLAGTLIFDVAGVDGLRKLAYGTGRAAACAVCGRGLTDARA